MKRLLTSAAMFLCCIATSFAQFSGSGSGTESDPYLILNPIQLNQLRNYLNQQGVYFKLMADIDLTEFLEDENPSQGWQPVGTSSAPFKGILDGNGHTITGLWINRPNIDYVGFFGSSDGAAIKNLTLKGHTIVGNNYVGFISGNMGTIANSSFEGKVIGVSHVGGCVGYGGQFSNILSYVNVIATGDCIGGLSGENGSFQNCRIKANSIEGNNFVGGICGSDKILHNRIEYCYVYTDISGNDCVGGICGYKYDESRYMETPATILNCGYYGTITASNCVGGVCGKYYGGQRDGIEYGVDGCYAVGYIQSKGNDVGGIVGFSSQCNYNSGRPNYNSYYYSHGIRDSYFSGSVCGKENIGGIVGNMFTYTQIDMLSNYSNASVVGEKYVGGIVGFFKYASMKCNVAINSKVSATVDEAARIVGHNEGTISVNGSSNENKAWNRTIVINAGVAHDVTDDEQNGTGVSATTLKLKATYVAMGWDFTDTWAIQETECYPYMKTQTAPPVITSKVVSGATTISGKAVDGGTVTLEVDGVKQQVVSTGHEFSFTVSPLQAGHEVRLSAKADGKEQSYFTTETVSYLGKGTEADPYQVYTASDLTGVYRKGYYKLMNDIDLTSYINQFSPTEGWESIGREGSEAIHFDGDGHKITGLWCNSTRDNTGLFSCFANGTIKNLTVETATGKQVKGGSNTAILIGKMINGTIENCRVLGTIADGTPVGGLVGLFDGGKISLSQANVTINTTGEKSYVGGLVGEITGGEIDQCVTQGTITATGNESYVGGLVGKNSAIVTNCYSNAQIISTYNAAGLVAYNYNMVDKCYATGDLFTNNYAAGVIGYNDGENAVVSKCIAINNKIDVVYESQQTQQGGGYGQRIISGIKNGAPAPEMNNYALKSMQVSVNNVAQKVYDDIMNGAGKTGSELMKKTTYQSIGWDFTDIWSISEGENYPALKNNVASVITGDNTDDVTEVNTLFGIDIQTMADSKVVLPISLNNEDEIKLCQFDLRLPTGVTVTTKSNGRLDAKLTERAESHSISSQQLSNGDYRFVVSSLDNESFAGNSGTLMEITLDVAATMEAGEYSVKVLNVELSVPDGNDLLVVRPKDMESKLIVKSYTPGDVNNDGSVSVTDVGCAINYILEQVPSAFVFEAADMNGDKTVSVTDVGMIINLILNEGAASRRTEQMITKDAKLSLIPVEEGFELLLENEDVFIGFQFDVELGEGAAINDVRLAGDDDHVLTYQKLGNGKWRVVCYSPTNSTFSPNETSLLAINAEGNITISDIRLTTVGLDELQPAALIGTATGIANVERGMKISVEGQTLRITSDSDTTLRLYSLGGSIYRTLHVRKGMNRFEGLRSGIYMINNQKVIIR